MASSYIREDGSLRRVVGVGVIDGDADGRIASELATQLAQLSPELIVRRLAVTPPTSDPGAIESEEFAAKISPVLESAGVDVLVWARMRKDTRGMHVQYFVAVKSAAFEDSFVLPVQRPRELGLLNLTVLAAARDRHISKESVRHCVSAVDTLVASAEFNEQWAENDRWHALFDFARALERLGQHEPIYLARSPVYFEAALRESPREKAPTRWAETRRRRGMLLVKLGQTERRVRPLEDAVTDLRAALETVTRERSPRRWAEGQEALGFALVYLAFMTDQASPGAGEPGWNEAIVAFRAALDEQAREAMWVRALRKATLASVLHDSVKRSTAGEPAKARLVEANALYTAAVAEFPRGGDPSTWTTLDATTWADIQERFGRALLEQAQLDTSVQPLNGAIAAFRAALQVHTHYHATTEQAGLIGVLGDALRLRAEREDRPPCETVLEHLNALRSLLTKGSSEPQVEWTLKKQLQSDLLARPAPSEKTCPSLSGSDWTDMNRVLEAR